MTYKLLRVRQIPREYCSLFLLIITMFVHTCLFFFSTFHFRSRLSILLFFHSLFSSYSYTYAYTFVSFLVLTIAYTRTRTHTTHKNTYMTYVCLITHASARTHTHVYILSLALSFVG